MSVWNQEFIYISHEVFSGTSKSGNDYVIRNLKVADPEVFENLVFNFGENMQFPHVQRGDRILLDIVGKSNYKGNSSIEVIGIQKVK